jgi:hypothetical protein
MDRTEALDIMEAVRNKVPEADRVALDAEYASRFMEIVPTAGSLAVEGAQSDTTTATPEVTPEAPVISREGLLATLDTALTTFSSQVDVVNGERAKVKGRKKPEQLKAVDQNVIRAEVEALVSNPAILADLQAEADYFTANPEADSPAVGFDIVIVPEGLTDTDDEAIARDVQSEITTQYSPYIRGSRYNDKRTPEVTGKGYRIAFAPRHYNVPSGTTTTQTKWMRVANTETTATQLETATDAEALAQIHNLEVTGALDDPDTRFHTSYFRRFDQAPVGVRVSGVYVRGYGGLVLVESGVDYDRSARALVVPKKA